MHFPLPRDVIDMGAGLLVCWIAPDSARADEIPLGRYAVVAVAVLIARSPGNYKDQGSRP